jgi:hypothetical protein
MVATHRHPHPEPDPRLFEQLRALPDHLVGEILNGRLIVSPRPSSPHAFSISSLGMVLGSLFQHGSGGGPGGWWILFEPELHLGGDVFAPDLAGWRKSRMPVLPDVPALTLAPDWVCEGLSGSGTFDRDEKLPAYARHGVRHAWLMEPRAHTLEVFRNERGAFRPVAIHKGPVRVKAEPFQAADLDLSLLWLPGSRPSGRRRKGKV